jgi:hypothetical protein
MTQLVVWLNIAANTLGRVVLAPLPVLPGWLSATLVACGTGIVMLLAFKYTSNQRAIKRVRNDIKANLLALSLFKENIAVSLRAQGRILLSAGKLLLLAVVPVLVMIVPVTLLLGQLALWYQARPLALGEEAVITLKLSGNSAGEWPDVRLEPAAAIEPTLGPVRVTSQRRLCWNIRALGNGYHRLAFAVGEQTIEKELAVGNGFLRTSPVRPAWNWEEALLYPWEEPFRPDSPVESIEIDYPSRSSWTCGSNSWIVYWFAVSMVAAFACRRAFNVNL